jgi:HEAT repeat protein
MKKTAQSSELRQRVVQSLIGCVASILLAGSAMLLVRTWHVSKTSDWIAQLEGADPSQRRHAALMLNEMAPHTADVQNALISILDDDNVGVRRMAAGGLAKFNELGADAAAALVVAIDDEDEFVRANSALALGQVSEPGANVIVALERAEQDTHDLVRQQAREARQKIAARGRK